MLLVTGPSTPSFGRIFPCLEVEQLVSPVVFFHSLLQRVDVKQSFRPFSLPIAPMSHSGHGDSAPSTDGSSGAAMHATMIPYFHAGMTGDHLFLKAWVPNSPGAIVGACIGLFLIGILDRWLSAMRSSFEAHWKHRAMLLSSRYSTTSQELSRSSTPSEKAKASVSVEEEARDRIPSLVPKLRPRTIPPFVASHDIPRGILHAFQSAIGFLLMLATMSYRIEWICSILLGLGLGETLFGRYGAASVH